MRRLLAASILVLALAGCAGQAGSKPANPERLASSATKASAEPATYSTAGDLANALNDSGVLNCTKWTEDNDDAAMVDEGASPVLLGAAASASCGDDYRLAIFASTESRDGTADMVRANDARGDPTFVGSNWIVNGPDVEKLAGELDGKVIESEFDVQP